MNLSKELKKKRDAEDRLRNRSPVTAFSETIVGEQKFIKTDDFATKAELEDKSDVDHNHDTDYADASHNHNSVYSKLGHTHLFRYCEPLLSLGSEFFYFEGDILTGEVV